MIKYYNVGKFENYDTHTIAREQVSHHLYCIIYKSIYHCVASNIYDPLLDNIYVKEVKISNNIRGYKLKNINKQNIINYLEEFYE